MILQWFHPSPINIMICFIRNQLSFIQRMCGDFAFTSQLEKFSLLLHFYSFFAQTRGWGVGGKKLNGEIIPSVLLQVSSRWISTNFGIRNITSAIHPVIIQSLFKASQSGYRTVSSPINHAFSPFITAIASLRNCFQHIQ